MTSFTYTVLCYFVTSLILCYLAQDGPDYMYCTYHYTGHATFIPRSYRIKLARDALKDSRLIVGAKHI